MNRRSFLRRMSSGLVIAVTPVIFLPPRPRWIQSAHGGYLIDIDHQLIVSGESTKFASGDIDWMLKTCWDASRTIPDRLYVTKEGIELQRSRGIELA